MSMVSQLKELCKIYGTSDFTMRKILRDQGHDPSKNPRGPKKHKAWDHAEDIKQLYLDGTPIKEIAKQYDTSDSMTRSILRSLNVSLTGAASKSGPKKKPKQEKPKPPKKKKVKKTSKEEEESRQIKASSLESQQRDCSILHRRQLHNRYCKRIQYYQIHNPNYLGIRRYRDTRHRKTKGKTKRSCRKETSCVGTKQTSSSILQRR